MRKIFIALSVVAVLAFSLAPAMANVPGAMDISPGSGFKTYFLVSKDRVDTGSGPSTLLQISETKGKVGLSALNTVIWSRLHFNVYTIDSKWVFDFKIPITRWQTLLKDFGKVLQDYKEMVSALAVTFEGQTYYAGYVVVVEDMFVGQDNILADVIQCDLSAGIAAGANIPMKAYVDNLMTCEPINSIATAYPLAIPVHSSVYSNYEVFSGAAQAAAKELAWGRACPANSTFATAGAGWFAMYPRYLINDANAETYWFILRSSLASSSGALVQNLSFHTWVINGAEDWRSVTIDIRELSILKATQIVPSVLKVSYPYIGQINLKIPGDVNTETGTSVPPREAMFVELIGWNWKVAKSATGSLNWGAMTLMASDASTSGAGTQPNY